MAIMPISLSYPGSKWFIQGTCRCCKGGTCGYLERSEDGGQTWQRTEIPELDTYASCSSPWSYDQLPDGTVIRVFAVRRSAEEPYLKRVVAVLTRDGRTAQVVEVMGVEAEGFTTRSIIATRFQMPKFNY